MAMNDRIDKDRTRRSGPSVAGKQRSCGVEIVRKAESNLKEFYEGVHKINKVAKQEIRRFLLLIPSSFPVHRTRSQAEQH
jgi:hypothetical protein